MTLDVRSFRRVLGCFASGVTVVTAIDPATGQPVGVTVSAFSTLTLDPPLVLGCLGRTGSCLAPIQAAGRFAVNILAEDQRDLSNRFAGPVDLRWVGQDWTPLPGGAPALPFCLASLDCALDRVVDGGDHLILIGRVDSAVRRDDGHPLIHHRGAYLDRG